MTICIEQREVLVGSYIGYDLKLILIADTRSVFTFTADSGTDTLTTTIAHDFLLNTRVKVSVSGGGSLPSPLLAGTIYYVSAPSGSDLQLSATRGGAVIDLANDGSGTLSITDVALDYTVRDMSGFTRKELTDYQGLTDRPAFTVAASVSTNSARVHLVDTVILDNSGGSADLVFDGIFVIKDGFTTIGDTTGTKIAFDRTSAVEGGAITPKIIPAGQSDTYSLQVIDTLPVI